MKYILYFLLAFFVISCTSKEDKEYILEITQERSLKNNDFVGNGTPIMEDEIGTFSGLKYFPINVEMKMFGKLEVFPKPESVLLEQGDTLKRMLKYGKCVFEINSQEIKLTVYKPIKNMFSEEEDYLFVPFFDETNGISTYEGGRYIYPEVQSDGSLLVDFNTASNPYCAYNHKYNCVVPPMENSIPFEINAGEKSYH